MVYIPDVHCGDQDNRAVALAVKVIKHVKPSMVVQLGDFLDMWGLASFQSGTSSPHMALQNELTIAHEIMQTIRDAAPRAYRFMLEGNHEARMGKWLERTPAMQDLRDIKLEKLLKLEKLGWGSSLLKSFNVTPSFIATHGSLVAKDAGISAKQEMMAAMSSGISGHTHRLATYRYTATARRLSWTEAGHLQSNPPRWRNGTQNWQAGVVVAEHDSTGAGDDSIQTVAFSSSYNCRVDGTKTLSS